MSLQFREASGPKRGSSVCGDQLRVGDPLYVGAVHSGSRPQVGAICRWGWSTGDTCRCLPQVGHTIVSGWVSSLGEALMYEEGQA